MAAILSQPQCVKADTEISILCKIWGCRVPCKSFEFIIADEIPTSTLHIFTGPSRYLTGHMILLAPKHELLEAIFQNLLYEKPGYVFFLVCLNYYKLNLCQIWSVISWQYALGFFTCCKICAEENNLCRRKTWLLFPIMLSCMPWQPSTMCALDTIEFFQCNQERTDI